jgi:beta-N-acetylglucosaminidase
MNNNSQKTLSDVFKELEQSRNIQIEMYNAEKKQKEETSFLFHFKTRTKFDNIKLILIVLVILFIFSLFSSNYIFAKDLEFDEEKQVIGSFEENNEPADVYSIMSENMSSTYQKEIFDRDEEVEFEIEYIENKDMPKDETKIVQEGIIGSKKVTYVRSYENNRMTEENSIGEVINSEPQTEIIEVGTSEILKQYNIHIGDNLYVSQNIELRKTPSMSAEYDCIVPAYYDVKTIEVIDDSWVKLEYDNFTGYILCNYLTSETLTPGISEVCRKSKILNQVDFNMNLNEVSGLTENDYKTVFASQEQDTNNVFKENYKAFYEAEQKYGINGVFLASIAIHESNWGKSSIAVNKHNLFGFGAYDASPYESAVTFESYADGIDTVAAWLASRYLNSANTVLKNGDVASGLYFNGATLSGVNVRYASDSEWANKVYNTMQTIYSCL